MDLQVNKVYELIFPKPSRVTARLVKIQTYPALGAPPDYIFKYISGDKSLAEASDKGKLEFCQKMWHKWHADNKWREKEIGVKKAKEETKKLGPLPTKTDELGPEEFMTFALPPFLLIQVKIKELKNYKPAIHPHLVRELAWRKSHAETKAGTSQGFCGVVNVVNDICDRALNFGLTIKEIRELATLPVVHDKYDPFIFLCLEELKGQDENTKIHYSDEPPLFEEDWDPQDKKNFISSLSQQREEPAPIKSYSPKPKRAKAKQPVLSFNDEISEAKITGAGIESNTVKIAKIEYSNSYTVSLTEKIRIFYTENVPGEEPDNWSEVESEEIFSWECIYHEKDAKIVKGAFDKITKLSVAFKVPFKDKYAVTDSLISQRNEQLSKVLETNKALSDIKTLLTNLYDFLHTRENAAPYKSDIFMPKSLAPEVVDLTKLTKEELIEMITCGIRPVLNEVPSFNDKKLELVPIKNPLFLDDKFKAKQLMNRKIALKQFHEKEAIQIASTESFEKLCDMVDFSSHMDDMLEPIGEELKHRKTNYVGRITEAIYSNGDRDYIVECA
jgi:hypothetical protein